jgi:hypothetical protein
MPFNRNNLLNCCWDRFRKFSETHVDFMYNIYSGNTSLVFKTWLEQLVISIVPPPLVA